MLKFGLLLVLANLCLKIILGIGLWMQAIELKSNTELKASGNYNEEQIQGGNPDILRGQNNKGFNDFAEEEENQNN